MDALSERIKWIKTVSKSVLRIDYSDLKDDQMLEVLSRAETAIREYNQPISIISIFNDRCFVTPRFMRSVEKATSELKHLFEKQAVVGLSPVKKMILKGYNFAFNFDILNFESEEEALKDLLP